ncbi:hypothetical protein A1Q2_02571 [Trichosporon asahii var. asahii CBS 8904]|uniref:Uncharacterized protein n=1 Tax=Trichosporon asahii var. asahii (strain CBS 8904) TaxID=1220162 RepID=K1VUE1_TRIAC|nr:hypothetical protein A1Q2_02571 [Trichosporon asahii var. asahii CBS 8904]
MHTKEQEPQNYDEPESKASGSSSAHCESGALAWRQNRARRPAHAAHAAVAAPRPRSDARIKDSTNSHFPGKFSDLSHTILNQELHAKYEDSLPPPPVGHARERRFGRRHRGPSRRLGTALPLAPGLGTRQLVPEADRVQAVSLPPFLSISLPQQDGRLADVSIEMNEEERSTIDAATRRDPASWAELSLSSSAFWHPDLRELRVYFPVRDALLTHGRSLVEANERGELAERALEGDYRVLGRRATDDVHGVPSNVIRDGLVLLSSPWGHAYKRADNVYVYDFGVRSAHDHHDAHLDARDKKGKVSCYKNHGNKICSFLPGCRQNRCAAPSRSSKSCVDYNGWPDCKGQSKKGFIGSDCQVALAKGKCWNEVIMKKPVNEVASSEKHGVTQVIKYQSPSTAIPSDTAKAGSGYHGYLCSANQPSTALAGFAWATLTR